MLQGLWDTWVFVFIMKEAGKLHGQWFCNFFKSKGVQRDLLKCNYHALHLEAENNRCGDCVFTSSCTETLQITKCVASGQTSQLSCCQTLSGSLELTNLQTRPLFNPQRPHILLWAQQEWEGCRRNGATFHMNPGRCSLTAVGGKVFRVLPVLGRVRMQT